MTKFGMGHGDAVGSSLPAEVNEGGAARAMVASRNEGPAAGDGPTADQLADEQARAVREIAGG
jgi:hypothetical protein